MEKENVLEKLCAYDKRNPEYIDDEVSEKLSMKRKNCYCDNCFYGRTELAEEILKLQEKLNENIH